MTRLTLDITMSLDGFIAGPNQTLERPLGDGGERLHEWLFELAAFREQHGLSGGRINADAEVLEESLGATGSVVMGRRMFSGGEGPWEDDPNVDGWWGDDPPFHVPVFVLTHHPRENVVPLLPGDGVLLFDRLGSDQVELEGTRVIQSPAVTHVKYRVK
jgi:dihydrofolate reductase